MTGLRVLVDRLGTELGTDLDDTALARAYETPPRAWLRANCVTTVDGAASGADGLSGSINNDVDARVFHLLRQQTDAIVVGAGTARAERYGVADRPVIVVSRAGSVPETLRGGPRGMVLLATCEVAQSLEESRTVLGEENVLVLGSDSVDLPRMLVGLRERGLTQLLCEGGPHLLGDLLAAGLVDELCVTQVPMIAAGTQSRITAGPDLAGRLELRLMLEHEGTLLTRWLVQR